MPSAAASFLVNSLSMAAAEANTLAPTYGIPAISSRPWMVPSSPYAPCSTGNTTSTSPSAPAPCAGSSTTRPRAAGSPARTPEVPHRPGIQGRADRGPLRFELGPAVVGGGAQGWGDHPGRAAPALRAGGKGGGGLVGGGHGRGGPRRAAAGRAAGRRHRRDGLAGVREA